MTAEMVRLYLDDKKSIPQISTVIGIPRSTVRLHLIKAGVELRTRGAGIRLRVDILGKHAIGVPRHFTDEWKENLLASRRRWNAEHAVGTTIKQNGYIEYTMGPNKGRSVHRVVLEEKLGRRLGSHEVSHHIDEDKSNNDPDNLVAMTRSEHTSLHRRKHHVGIA